MTIETENNDKELGCDALLCRLRELRDKKKVRRLPNGLLKNSTKAKNG